MYIIDSLTALEPRARSCVCLGSIRGGACSRVGPARQFVDIAKQRRGVTSARHHRSSSTLRSSVDSVASVTPSARTSGASHEKSRLVWKAMREVSTRRLFARNLGVACALTGILLVIGCGDDGGLSTEDGGVTTEDGGTLTAECATSVPCVADEQCFAVAGTSCNTNIDRCQQVLCGGANESCSSNEHCAAGFLCETDRCVSEDDGDDDDGLVGLFVDAQWQVRCPRDAADCARDGEDVDVFDVAGESGVTASCSVDTAGGTRSVGFDIARAEHRLSIDGIQASTAGGPVMGSGCSVTVVHEGITYVGRCGSSPPNGEQPCQISGLSFIEERVGDTDMGRFGPEVVLAVTCEGIPATSDPTRLRDLYRSRSAGTVPANVRLINCDGL